ncbi:MAG: LCP family protein [Actinobacteria bacterium]|nr:LCP family protein [Actinomycetota bacterium]MCO5300463.1 LCP family protein [Candidatus Nanopelagicales bacterium]HPE13373.1 LCP family protein [Actinomycetota bacterium]
MTNRGVPPEFESWMRPEGGEQPTQRLNAPGARRPVGSPTGPAPRPVGSPQRPAVQTLPRTIPPTKRRRRRWSVKRILLTALAVIAVYVTAVATVFATSVTKIDALPVSSVSSSGTNYLLVGSDSRVGLSAKEQKRLHTGSTEGQRTDTIMIMHVPLIGAPTLVSIPRDSWVGIPGYGQGKINSAFALGGPQLMITTVEEATGLHIDNYVEIGFAGVADTTDALGGVRLCPDRRYNDANSGLKVKKGCQIMDGQDALAYVRMRYADPRGDLGRVERQQEFMSAVAKRAMSPITWLLPWRAFGAASAAGGSLTVDKSTGIFDDARLAVAMGMISMGMGDATTVPTVDGSYYVGGQDAVKWDTPRALELFNSID